MTIPTTTPAVSAAASDEDETIFRKVQNLNGDCSRLSIDDRTNYVFAVCRKLGLERATQPFQFIQTPDRRVILYANRSCGDQLRKKYNISLQIVSRDVVDDILTIHTKATMPDGRSDEDLGCVAFGPGIKGEARANAELRAVTKSKRRVTLSICGLGWLDETEVEDIPGTTKIANTTIRLEPNNVIKPPPPIAPNVMVPPLPSYDPTTGEIIEDAAPAKPVMPPEIAKLADKARIAARTGTIDGFWPSVTKEQFEQLRPIFPELLVLKNEYIKSFQEPEPKTEAPDGSSPRRRARAATSQPPEPPVLADSLDLDDDASFVDHTPK